VLSKLIDRLKQPKSTPKTEATILAPSIASTSSNTPVSVQSVSKSFGDFTALRNVSFKLAKGECLGIVGMNGAGKSTLLQIIAGALKPTSGEVATNGRVVAMLELGTGFNPDYTGLENIYLNASILGIPRKVMDQKLPEIEAFAEIGDFIHKPVKTYSSGMGVRLAFSMLTQVDPDVMIIDEALSVGDAYFSHKCMNLIRRFREEGKTFLFVSHSPLAIKSLCDRAILLEKGSVTKSGSPQEVLDYYNAIIARKEEENLQIEQTQYKNRTVTRSGNGKARIQTFDLVDISDQPTRIFESGAVLRVYCSVKANISLNCPTLGILIKDRLGNDVFGTNTHHLDFQSGNIEKGETLNLVFEIQLNIGPGEYSVTLAAHEGDRHMIDNYDWYDGVVIFRVTPDPQTFFTGVARLPAKVEIAKRKTPPNRQYNYGYRITPQSETAINRYLTEGWSIVEPEHVWTDGSVATIVINLNKSTVKRTLRIELSPYIDINTPLQTINISISGENCLCKQLNKRSILEIPLPKKQLKNDQPLQISFSMPDAKTSNCSIDDRKLGIALHFFEII
jgi:lipopolysaccharide transport system ATP-binding protein